MQLSAQLSVCGQPQEGDFAEIAAAGYKSVVNNRPAGEDPTQLDPAFEAELAQRHGLAYAHVPVPPLTAAAVDAMRAALKSLPQPVLVHCRSGTRSRNLLAVALAAEENVADAELPAFLGRFGLPADEGLIGFIQSYRAGA